MAPRIVQQGSGSKRPLVLVYHLNASVDGALRAAAGPNALIANDTTVGSTYSNVPSLAQTVTQLTPPGVMLSPIVLAGFSAGGLATERILSLGGDPDALVIADGTYASAPSQWAPWQRYAERAMAGQRTFLTSYTSWLGATSTWHVLCAITGVALPVGSAIDGVATWQRGNFTVYGYPTSDMPGHLFQGSAALPSMIRSALAPHMSLTRAIVVGAGVLVASALAAYAITSPGARNRS